MATVTSSYIEILRKSIQGVAPVSAGSPAEARRKMASRRRALGPGPEMARVTDMKIPVGGGAIEARLFLPAGELTALVVYVHGGGWTVGDLDDFDSMCRTLAKESGSAVLLPAYRLAPEHPFPIPLEDTQCALLFAQENTDELIGQSLPLVAVGDSAGANMITVVSRRLRGKLRLRLQVLIYPVTDCDFATPSYADPALGLALSREDMQWFFRNYAPASLWSSPDISPLRSDDLGGLPPAIITTAEYDVLRDEGKAYAAKLRRAGVPVVERHLTGLAHGYIRSHNLFDAVREELATIANDIRKACSQATV